MVTDGSEWCRDVMDEAYVPIPYPEEKFEPVEWLHCLATLDVCTMNHGTKFCDANGYDIVPIRMINVFPYDQSEALSENEIHPRKGGTELSTTESGSLYSEDESSESRFTPVPCYCDCCGIDYLFWECPYNVAKRSMTKSVLEQKETPQAVAKLKLSTYIEIMVMSSTKMLPVYARFDPKISHNILSYEDWEALEQPPLKSL